MPDGPMTTLTLDRSELALADPVAFRWQDGERLIVFGANAVDQAQSLLGEGYALLTTPRAARRAPDIVTRASAVHEVPGGRVDELAAGLRDEVRGELLVALGGGRVIDTAKALAAADPPRRVAAVPTTLSGAEMTAIHRHATGLPPSTTRVRPAIVINDPALAGSQPPAAMAQSAANALGHAAEGPLTPLRNPAATAMALQGARLLVEAMVAPEVDRGRAALASLLCGYVIGATGYGLHHVVSQTLARFAGLSHGAANAIMLPHSLRALTGRFPAELDRLARALGADPVAVARWLCERTGTTTLRAAGATAADLERCADEAASRSELALTPPAATRDELRELYMSAF